MTDAAEKEMIRNRDMLALKQYIQAQDDTRYQAVDELDLVLLDLSHSNLKQVHVETRFSRHDTIANLRAKIYLKTGTPPSSQDLYLYDGATEVARISPANEAADNLPLGYFGLQHGIRVHCVDLDPNSGSAGGAYENTSLVEKYRMTDEEYNSRKGTLREWARKQQEQNPSFSLQKHATRQRMKAEAQKCLKQNLPLPKGWYIDNLGLLEYDSDVEKDEEVPTGAAQKKSSNDSTCGRKTAEYVSDTLAAGIEVGMRCQVEPGRRRGKIGYVGLIPELPGNGLWVGVILDEPLGQNDGRVKGNMYMPNTPGSQYGVFCRPNNVQVGDFPERDLDDSDDDDEL